MPKLYVHPINTQEFYVDDQPVRDLRLALSPHPDTVGPFENEFCVDIWRGLRLPDAVQIPFPFDEKII